MKVNKYTLILSIFFMAVAHSQNYNGNVGIGTNDPKNNLDIRGNLKVIPETSPKEDNIDLLSVVKNANAGENKIVSNEKIGYDTPIKDKMFFLFNVKVKLGYEHATYVKYNTNIPVKDYTLVLIQADLEDLEGQPAAVSHLKTSFVPEDKQPNHHIAGNSPKRSQLINEDGKWVLYSDFPYTQSWTQDKTNKTQWNFTLLAIKTTKANIIDATIPDKDSQNGISFLLNSSMKGGRTTNPIK